MGAEQMLEGVLVAAHARADEIPAIDPEDLGMVLRGIDVLEGEAQVTPTHAIDHVLGDRRLALRAGLPGLVHERQRVRLVELWVERQPAESHRQRVLVSRVPSPGREARRPGCPQ